MGTHRFRLSDMIPNSWFHKMMYMSRTRNPNTNHPRKKKTPPTSSKPLSPSITSSSTAASIPPQESKTEQPHVLSYQRKSYYIRRELTPPPQPPNPKFPQNKSTESPRKSPKQTRRRRSIAKRRNRVVTTSSSASSCCSCRDTVESVWTNPDSTSEDYPIFPLDSSSDLNSLDPEFDSNHDHGLVSSSSCCYCGVQKNIVIDKNEEKSLTSQLDGFDKILEIELPPIVTKRPNKFTNGIQSTNQQQRTSPVRSPGMRLRTNSPIIATRKIQAYGRKSGSSSCRSRRGLSKSYAVVKSSADPQRDFLESMVEMIMENNLRTSKDFEDLLACYLQLNSDEYHELIVEVFKQIWFDIAGVSVK